MASQNEKLEVFIQNILKDAQQESGKIMEEIDEERKTALSTAEDEVLADTYRYIKREVARIKTDYGRIVSKKVLDNRCAIYARRQEIEQDIIDEIIEKIEGFSKTPEYLPHLSELLSRALTKFGGAPAVVYLRGEDMPLADILRKSAQDNTEFKQSPSIRYGGLIVDCPSKMLRVDESIDAALDDMKGHIAEMIGLDLADA